MKLNVLLVLLFLAHIANCKTICILSSNEDLNVKLNLFVPLATSLAIKDHKVYVMLDKELPLEIKTEASSTVHPVSKVGFVKFLIDGNILHKNDAKIAMKDADAVIFPLDKDAHYSRFYNYENKLRIAVSVDGYQTLRPQDFSGAPSTPDSFYEKPENLNFFWRVCRYFWLLFGNGPYGLGSQLDLLLINDLQLLSEPVPLLPNQIQVPGLHINRRQPLSSKVTDYLNISDPAIYFEGSRSQGSSNVLDLLRKPIEDEETLSKSVRILRRGFDGYEEDQGVELDNNVFIDSILGHENVKILISLCDLTTVQSALFANVPVICIPSTTKQKEIARVLEDRKLAKVMPEENMKSAELRKAIHEIKSPEYTAEFKRYSEAFREEAVESLEKAVWYIHNYMKTGIGRKVPKYPGQNLWSINLVFLDTALIFAVFVSTTAASIFWSYKKCSLRLFVSTWVAVLAVFMYYIMY